MPASKLLLFLFCWLRLAVSAGAQQPFSKNYQLSDGLLSNYIYSVFQDSKGYIWLSTDVGASRFDGQRFVHFNTVEGLPDNEIFSISEDKAGRIWFATLNGKAGFFQNGVLYNENNTDWLKNCRLNGLAIKLLILDDGRVVYCNNYKTLFIDPERQTVERFTHEKGTITVWKNDANEIGCGGKRFMKMDGRQVRELEAMPQMTQTIQSLRLGDTIVISADKTIYFFERETGKMRSATRLLNDDNQFIFIQKIGNRLWAGTRKGLYVYHYPSLLPDKTLLPGHSVSGVMEDREGGLWCSTFGDGLFYIPDPGIIHYDVSSGLLYNRVNCLSRDAQHRLWIGSDNSAYSIFEQGRIASHHIFSKNVVNKNTKNIRHLADGSTLIISKAGTRIIRNGRSSLFLHRASDLNIDAQGKTWVGLNGIFEIPPALAARKTIATDAPIDIPDAFPLYGMPTISRLGGLRIEKVEPDRQHNIWFATHNGLYRVGPDSQETRILTHSIKDLEMDPSGDQFWALSESNGLFLIKNGQIADSIAILDQHGTAICRDLCRDASNQLWIGATSGLFNVQYHNGVAQLTHFKGVTGFGSDKINAIEVIENQVFIGKDDGLLSLPVSVLFKSPPSPPAFIKGLRLRDSLMVPDPRRPIQVEMDYGSGSIAIEFEGLTYREPQYIRYRYRLIGLDSMWRETTTEAVEYASLRPGNYRFEVLSVNGLGETAPLAAQLTLIVHPPYWMRPWFYVCAALVFFAGLGAWVRRRERRLRQRHEVEKQWVESSRERSELKQKNTELRMLALRLQMNPHFIFNALNTIKGYYGQEKTVEANAFIGKFARLLRLNLDYSDAMIPLDQEIELLKIYLQLSQTRYPGKITFDIQVPAELHTMDIMIPSMLLQPFVENAVIHGVAPKDQPGNIRIAFEKDGDELKVCIIDNGVGRSASGHNALRDPHKPLATQITIERLQLLRKRQTPLPLVIRDLFQEGMPAGTEVTLYIPCQHIKHTT